MPRLHIYIRIKMKKKTTFIFSVVGKNTYSMETNAENDMLGELIRFHKILYSINTKQMLVIFSSKLIPFVWGQNFYSYRTQKIICTHTHT